MLDCVKTLLEQTARQIENSKGRCAVADESIAEANAALTISWDVIARCRVILARNSPKLSDFAFASATRLRAWHTGSS